MEPVEVTARFDLQGKIIPVRMVWQGRVYRVASTGRRWQDEAGVHILAMLPADRVAELVFSPGEMRWYLEWLGPGRIVA